MKKFKEMSCDERSNLITLGIFVVPAVINGINQLANSTLFMKKEEKQLYNFIMASIKVQPYSNIIIHNMVKECTKAYIKTKSDKYLEALIYDFNLVYSKDAILDYAHRLFPEENTVEA